MTPRYGIGGLRFCMIGMLVSLILMGVISLMTEEPDKETQDTVEAIKVPKGKPYLVLNIKFINFVVAHSSMRHHKNKDDFSITHMDSSN